MVRAYLPQRIHGSINSNSSYPSQGNQLFTGPPPPSVGMAYENSDIMTYEDGNIMGYE